MYIFWIPLIIILLIIAYVVFMGIIAVLSSVLSLFRALFYSITGITPPPPGKGEGHDYYID